MTNVIGPWQDLLPFGQSSYGCKSNEHSPYCRLVGEVRAISFTFAVKEIGKEIKAKF
jgi:hypothetical protein